MKKSLPIYLYGAVIILVGVFLLVSKYFSMQVTHISISVPLIIGAFIAFVAAFNRQSKQVQFSYHSIHALAMLVYGVAIVLISNKLETFTYATAFLFVFYSFSEIIFCNWLFNLGQKVYYKIIAVRLILGIAIGLGTVLSMNYAENTLEGFGILFIAVGINILLYVPVMKLRPFEH